MSKLPPRQHPPEADYEVGYGKPPKAHQFGARAQPKRQRKNRQIDLAAVLDEPVKVARGDKVQKLHPHEALMRALGKQALGGNMRAAKGFLKECQKAGLLDQPANKRRGGSVFVPLGFPHDLLEYLLYYFGRPPWDSDDVKHRWPGYESMIEQVNKENQVKLQDNGDDE
jgi:hypothetical protein